MINQDGVKDKILGRTQKMIFDDINVT